MIDTPSGVYYTVQRQSWHLSGDGGADKDYDEVAERATFREALAVALTFPGQLYIDEVNTRKRGTINHCRLVCKVRFNEIAFEWKAQADACLAQQINEREIAA